MAARPQSETTSASLHAKRFPGEDANYRAARDALLRAEVALRKSVEDVAAARRKLPPGGALAQDYAFDEGAADLDDRRTVRQVRMSELFVRPDASLAVYSFMYGPKMARPCPMCTSILDALDRTAQHATQRINLAVVARSPVARIREFARERGWRNLRLLSSAGNRYNLDYFGEDDQGAQWPMLNVFARRDGTIRHTWGSELMFAPSEPGQDPRHVDAIWPLWNLFDVAPEGRGADWYPQLRYDG